MIKVRESSTEAQLLADALEVAGQSTKCALSFVLEAHDDLHRGSLTPEQRDLLRFVNDSIRLTIYGLIKELYGESVLDLTVNLIESNN
jgi:hypothetical protein